MGMFGCIATTDRNASSTIITPESCRFVKGKEPNPKAVTVTANGIATKKVPVTLSLLFAKITYAKTQLAKASTQDTANTPPVEAIVITVRVNACEYPNAFQLFPVTQYRKNSVATHTNGAASIATEPNLRSNADSTPANIAGNSPATAATQKNNRYATIGGKPA